MNDPYTVDVVSVAVILLVNAAASPLCCSTSLIAETEVALSTSSWSSVGFDTSEWRSFWVSLNDWSLPSSSTLVSMLSTLLLVLDATHLYSPSSSSEMEAKRNADPVDWWMRRRDRRRWWRRRRTTLSAVSSASSWTAPRCVAHLCHRIVRPDLSSMSGRWHCSVNPWPSTASTVWTWPSCTNKYKTNLFVFKSKTIKKKINDKSCNKKWNMTHGKVDNIYEGHLVVYIGRFYWLSKAYIVPFPPKSKK